MTSDQPVRIFRLTEITSLIKEALLEVAEHEFWVRAHLIAPRREQRSGHYYCELTDVDATGNTIAKTRAIMWRSNYLRITEKLQSLGMPDILKDNSEVCVLCSVRYHEVYGLSLDIYDIDPTFGESQIDLNRRRILERLKEEEILDRNKATRLPAASLRIGLITARESAAYGDFTKTILASPFAFHIVVADCPMQGEDMKKELISALQRLMLLEVDVICIVRGGGSQTDLAWFDDEDIARAVLDCAIPIWVGIGHEIDVGVLDVIAHRSWKTPTAVAEELVRRLQELVVALETAKDTLKHIVDRRVSAQEQFIERRIHGATMGFRKQLELATARMNTTNVETRASFQRVLAAAEADTMQRVQSLRHNGTSLLDAKQTSFEERRKRFSLARYLRIVADRQATLSNRARYLEAMLPNRVLQRGYTITRDSSGQVLKTVSQTKEGQAIETQFADGSVPSIVTNRR